MVIPDLKSNFLNYIYIFFKFPKTVSMEESVLSLVVLFVDSLRQIIILQRIR